MHVDESTNVLLITARDSRRSLRVGMPPEPFTHTTTLIGSAWSDNRFEADPALRRVPPTMVALSTPRKRPCALAVNGTVDCYCSAEVIGSTMTKKAK